MLGQIFLNGHKKDPAKIFLRKEIPPKKYNSSISEPTLWQ